MAKKEPIKPPKPVPSERPDRKPPKPVRREDVPIRRIDPDKPWPRRSDGWGIN
jgi:hypothetical protein